MSVLTPGSKRGRAATGVPRPGRRHHFATNCAVEKRVFPEISTAACPTPCQDLNHRLQSSIDRSTTKNDHEQHSDTPSYLLQERHTFHGKKSLRLHPVPQRISATIDVRASPFSLLSVLLLNCPFFYMPDGVFFTNSRVP